MKAVLAALLVSAQPVLSCDLLAHLSATVIGYVSGPFFRTVFFPGNSEVVLLDRIFIAH